MLSDNPVSVLVAASDRERARAFYRDTLGLKLSDEDRSSLVFAVRGAELRVSIVGTVTTLPRSVLGWTVPDIREAVLALRERGVAFERFPGVKHDAFGIWTGPAGAKVAWFKDPDGNVLSLMEATMRQIRSSREA